MIIQLEEAKLKLGAMKDQVREYGITIKIEELKKTASEMDAQMEASDFWNDQVVDTAFSKVIGFERIKCSIFRKADASGIVRILQQA